MDYDLLEKRICDKLGVEPVPQKFSILKDSEAPIIYLIVQALSEYDKMRLEETKKADAK